MRAGRHRRGWESRACRNAAELMDKTGEGVTGERRGLSWWWVACGRGRLVMHVKVKTRGREGVKGEEAKERIMHEGMFYASQKFEMYPCGDVRRGRERNGEAEIGRNIYVNQAQANRQTADQRGTDGGRNSSDECVE